MGGVPDPTGTGEARRSSVGVPNQLVRGLGGRLLDGVKRSGKGRPGAWRAQARADPANSSRVRRRIRLRGLASADRAAAAEERRLAAIDREMAGRERAQAASDRALAEAAFAQAELIYEAAEIDDLTRVRRRDAGLRQLQREIDRAKRFHETLVVVFVDVDGLKRVNDVEGHIAGDAVLVAVADALRACLRSYDVIFRFGGDEFVCALANADGPGIRTRLLQVGDRLSRGPVTGSISYGLALLGEGDAAMDLVARADATLLTSRRR